MRFSNNLATRRYIDVRKLNFALISISILLMLFLFYNSIEISKNISQINKLQGELVKYEGKPGIKTQATQPSAKESQELRARLSNANEIISRKTFNWLKLLDELEVTIPQGVALKSIEPDIKNYELKIVGVVNSFVSLRRCVENFEKSNFFSDVYLISQREIVVGSTQKGIDFTISCKVRF